MSEKVYVLRTCKADMTSHDGFEWPESGPVECSDWDPKPECGNGLHGLLWGEGSGELLCWDDDAQWLVVEVDAADVVDLDGKVKFPRGVVVFCGDRRGATERIIELGARGAVVGAFVTSGDRGTSTSGERGTSTSGYCGKSTSGYCGKSTSGDCGTSTSGERGTSTSGYGGTSTSGDGGTSTSGYGGTLVIRYFDGTRPRLAVAYVGENGIKADTPYCVNDKGEFCEVTP